MNLQQTLDEIVADLRPDAGRDGKVATYIPALAEVDPTRFGMALRTVDGLEASAGDAQIPFSIQSVSKVFTLTMAMQLLGEKLWESLGREPSGNPFNSLVQLESEQGVPRNPFINAGAIVLADRLIDKHGDAKRACAALLAFVRHLTGNPVDFDGTVADSEARTGARNRALAWFMKSFGQLHHAPEDVLGLYFHQCALHMSCQQLARAAGYLCRDGRHPLMADEAVLTDRQARRVNAIMLTCGTYDAAGEFAFRIGLPCKSGVGGGILAVVPDRLTLAVWSPPLDGTGNSALGLRALEAFVRRTRLSVF